jgi:hypothetical protein
MSTPEPKTGILCKKPRFRKEEFWMNDVTEIYKNNNHLKFFPKYNTTRIEQLNAITRFSLYFTLLIIIFNFNQEWLYLPIATIVITVILYNINKTDNDGNKKQLEKILNIRKKEKEVKQDKIDEQMAHDGDKSYKLDIDTDEEQENYDLEAGFIDYDKELLTGPKSKIPKYQRNKPESLYTVEELEEYKRNTCRKPTKENPFMNPDITDYNNGDPPAACNAYDEDINDNMNLNFNHELFRDVDEVWERANSQRQFYTIPNTSIPNNQTEFANWLYKVPETCKEDGTQCLRYEDLRFQRR